ncbi:hypothetical protein GTPT_2169 [Tatumella ptyseos ATCC 33301]|uniref:Uncharacterized protein n=1 Tax=Tatumella ptyseos ATCC 33301 TaxID=1005995 RepID=A0A085JEH2_9GAMM|nr:hypothetical protein GTPT_2169 [Tatumella ptyseos ATCC 33301]
MDPQCYARTARAQNAVASGTKGFREGDVNGVFKIRAIVTDRSFILLLHFVSH